MKKRLFVLLCLISLILSITPAFNINAKENNDLSLPKKYDLRELGLVTPVKNQGKYGTCWIHGVVSSLESNALVRGFGEYDLSEYQIAYIAENIMPDTGKPTDGEGVRNYLPWYSLSGGWPEYAAIFMRGYALQLEETYPYSQIEEELPLEGIFGDGPLYMDSICSVQASDLNGIKRLIMQNGAVCGEVAMSACGAYSFYNLDTNAFYVPSYVHDYELNHVIAIVGWDDNYSKNNFATTPPGDGAFIVKNSWGTKYHDNGYFYISYYDSSFGKDTRFRSLTVTNQKPYDRIYEYDGGIGFSYLDDVTDVTINIQSEENESITAVRVSPTNFTMGRGYIESLEFNKTIATVNVYKGLFDEANADTAKSLYTQAFEIDYAGYQTLYLDKEVPLQKGSCYYIKVSFDHPLAYAIDAYKPLVGAVNEADGKPNETYVRVCSAEENNGWLDVAVTPSSRNAPGSACIKVLTFDRELTKAEIINIYLNNHLAVKIVCYALPVTIIIIIVITIIRSKARKKEIPDESV